MKKKLLAIAAAGALVLGGVLSASPAYAYNCGAVPSKTSTKTTVTNNGCTNVQAGIWRYISTSPTHYISAWNGNVATVTATGGTNAGNDYRGQVGGTTYAWASF